MRTFIFAIPDIRYHGTTREIIALRSLMQPCRAETLIWKWQSVIKGVRTLFRVRQEPGVSLEEPGSNFEGDHRGQASLFANCVHLRSLIPLFSYHDKQRD
ncbi:hypothetical protein Pla52n_70490 [Stieleria varia]|uniref:Uncharacterized protein n=1 Tax=Stieleria varia TaxID=2528005 RepID=A0A5C5ZJ28_9BACT|nr:hypothetical protein Pla52n_70490 [Stieleria varia]